MKARTKPKTGTREWAETNINIQLGCEHNCRYCYARYDAVHRFKRCTAQAWAEPVINNAKVDCDYRKYPGRLMFPSSHDITPRNINECMVVIRRLLDAGNQILIVSKPHFECITLMCETFKEYRRQITFRFTIGSVNDDVLNFWEPNAPSFQERLSCLRYAFEAGYNTSISCEPFLDYWPNCVYDTSCWWITDSFWLGLLRKFNQRVNLTDVTSEQMATYVDPLRRIHSNINAVKAYYRMLKDRPYVKFKDSIRAIIEKSQI